VAVEEAAEDEADAVDTDKVNHGQNQSRHDGISNTNLQECQMIRGTRCIPFVMTKYRLTTTSGYWNSCSTTSTLLFAATSTSTISPKYRTFSTTSTTDYGCWSQYYRQPTKHITPRSTGTCSTWVHPKLKRLLLGGWVGASGLTQVPALLLTGMQRHATDFPIFGRLSLSIACLRHALKSRAQKQTGLSRL
jgi:hypothetical protein